MQLQVRRTYLYGAILLLVLALLGTAGWHVLAGGGPVPAAREAAQIVFAFPAAEHQDAWVERAKPFFTESGWTLWMQWMGQWSPEEWESRVVDAVEIEKAQGAEKLPGGRQLVLIEGTLKKQGKDIPFAYKMAMEKENGRWLFSGMYLRKGGQR